MARGRAALGILLLVLAGLLAVAALGYYLATAPILSFPLLVLAVALALGAILMLRTSRSAPGDDLGATAASVEDPDHPTPIRAPMMALSSGKVGFAVTGGGTGLDNPKNKSDEDVGEEPH